MMKPLSKTQSLILGLVLSSVLVTPSCRCGKNTLNGGGEIGGLDNFDERFTAYRGAAGNTITVCPGQTAVLGSLDFTDITYSWEPTAFLDDPASARPTFTSTQPGNYVYTLTITDAQGRTVTSGVSAIVVPPPTAIIESDRPTVCAGGSLDFTGAGSFAAKGQSITSYAWDFNGDGTADSSEANPPAQAFPQVGNFPVALTVTDTLGCSGTETRNYPICDAPTATFSVMQQRVSESSGTVFFNVNLDAPAPADIRIPLAFSGTAAAGDYTGPTEIVIPAGTTMGTAQITIIDDALNEADETIVITLTVGGGAKPGTNATQTITIADNDLQPVLIINDVAADEGAATLSYTVTLSEPSGQVVTVNYATTAASADCADVGSVTGTLTFQPSETSKTISLPIVDDALDEDDEVALVTLSSALNATLLDTHAIGSGEQFGGRTPNSVYGIGTITDNDALPTISIADRSVTEQNPPPAITTSADFSLSLNTPSGRPVGITYTTFSTSASNGGDYIGSATTLVTFSPATHTLVSGVCTVTTPATSSTSVSIPIVNNTTPEGIETFTVELNSPLNVDVLNAVAVGTIIDDDPKPLITADSPYAAQATGALTFNVSLSTVSEETVTVNYATRDGNAVSGTNYVATSGTLTFAPGTRTLPVDVSLIPTADRDAFFFLSLTSPPASAGRTQSDQCFVGTILDRTSAPKFSITDVTVSESNNLARFTVFRSGDTAGSASVSVATSEASAKANIHYAETSTTLNFAAGEGSKTFAVAISDDTAPNPALSFFATLSSPVGAGIARARATATIIDNDQPAAAPALEARDAVVLENWGMACVTIVRAGVNSAATTASYNTFDVSAVQGPSGASGADYEARTGTIVFDPFEAVKSIGIPIYYSATSEPPETFDLSLSGPSGGVLSAPTGVVTILDVNGDPTFTISDATVLESAGVAQVTINFTGARGLNDVSIDFTTSNGSAVAGATGPTGADYTTTSGTILFTPFDFAKTIDIPINDDIIFEPSETFTVVLSAATGVTGIIVADATGSVRINDDDAPPLFAVSGAAVNEADGVATFAISLSRQSQVPLTVNYATSNGTALAGVTGPTGADYVAASGTAAFAPYQTVVNIPVTINDDLIDEDDETLRFTLSAPTAPATLGVSGATGTIADNDNPPVLSVSSPTVSEGGGNLSFVISIPVPSAKVITVQYGTSDGTANAGFDYTTTAGTATFAAGQTTQTVNVPVTDDAVFELAETLTLTLSSPTNATLGTPTGTGTITENEVAPTIAVNDVTFAEADGATRAFTVSLTRAASFAITVDYATANGTAAAGPTGDYLATTGTLTFAAGETSKPVVVSIVNDSVDEANEGFVLNLSNASTTPVAIAISDNQGAGTITDDDLPPTLSIANQQGPEGASGTTGTLGFAVTLSQASGLTVTVNYQTTAVTATAGTDYVTASGVVTFAPGETAKTVNVSVRGDNVDEPDETFVVDLATPANASIAVGTATGTIQNDDTAPAISIADRLNLPEGSTGSTNQQFTVTLNNPSGRVVTVDYTTQSGTATAGSDYNTATGTVTFPAGSVSQTIDVGIRGDLIDEDVETFTVTLSNPSNATILDGVADGSIANDDTPPTLSIADLTVTEGSGGGTAMATLTVTLSAQSGKPVTVFYVTADNTALAASDYILTGPLLLNFDPGVTSQQLTVPVQRDNLNELTEDFFVHLCSANAAPVAACTTGPSNASIADGSATVTITDDDAQPTLTIDDVSALEGPSGSTTTFTFTVSLSQASGRNVTFTAQTANGTVPDFIATAGSDYVAFGPTGRQIAAGATSTTIAITVNGDALDENNETFALNLTSVVGATVSKSSGAGEIRNDDTLPVITVNDQSFPEATGGSFTVSLSQASGRIVRVSYSTANGTAVAGSDFTNLATTVLTIPPGTTSVPVPVTITSDTLDEDNETFTLNLSAPENATIGDGTGAGTIVDDDAFPTLSINDVTTAEGTVGVGACTGGVTSTPFNFTVSMLSPLGSGRPITVDYATANGPTGVTGALAGSDYTAASGTLTFPVGSTGQTITVQVACDAIYEASQQFFVNLSNPLTGASGSTGITLSDAQGQGTITNDDAAPTIQFSQAAQSVGAGNTVNIGVTTSAVSELPVTATFARTAGSAATPADYSLAASPVTVPAGQTTASIALTATASPTNNATVVLTMSAPTNASLGAQTTNTTTIQTTLPKVYFTAATQSVNENVTTFTVTVEQAGATTDTTSIPFTLSGASTANTPADFSITTPSPLSIAGCTPGPCQRTITITVVNDTLDEAAETIILTLGTPTNAELHPTNPTTHTATINADASDLPPSLSVSSTSVNEPDTGTAPGSVNVTLSAQSGQAVTVQYVSINGPAGATGAVAPADYEALALTTLTFAPGVTGQTIPLVINGDVLDENNETFDVVLCRGVNNPPGIGCTAGPVNASIVGPTGTVTIADNDATPSLAIEPVAVSVNEPDTAETVNAVFTIRLTPVSGRPVTVSYVTANGPTGVTGAVAPQDYTALTTTLLTFAPGEIQKDIPVVVQGDLLNEANETFTFSISGATNATITAATGTGTIVDDDPLPSIVVDDAASVTEGTGAGTTNMDFRVRLTEASGRPVTVQFTTTSGTALVGTDFTGPSGTTGTITFPAGVTGVTSSVAVTRDSLDELTETMSFNLANATNAQITDANAVGTIIDDDNNSVLTIAPTGTTEGAIGTTKQLAFAVTLSPASGRPVSVTVTPATLGGNTAAAGTDYLATAGTVTFSPGQTSQTFNVTINGDDLDEDNETFTSSLSLNTGAALGAPSTALGTITDDDNTPTLSVSDVTVNEGNSGTTPAVFTVSLSSISGRDVRVTYVSANGTATTADTDYAALASTVLTIPAGQLSGTISATVNGDTRHEANETFVVNLSAAQTGAANDPVTITDNQGQATITNDDAQPELCIDDSSVTEGSSGTPTMLMRVRLTVAGSACATPTASGLAAGATYATTQNTALAGTDYTTASGTISIPVGATGATFTVPITPDLLDEDNETFAVTLTAPTNASFGDSAAVATILDDDNQPTVSILGPTGINEGNAGQTPNLIFTVQLDAASGKDVTVSYATADGTATTGDSDYVAKSGSVIIPAGSTSTTISVQITGDNRFEPDQTFTVNLSSPVNAAVGTAQSTGTIRNDDAAPTIAIANASLTEGNTGTANMTFTVTVTGSAGVPITFNYASANGTATAGTDYTAVNVTGASIPADTPTFTFNVAIAGDTIWEGNETFTVTMSAPTNATITTATGTGTITDNDPAPTLMLSYLVTQVCEGTSAGPCQTDPGGPYAAAPSQQVQVSAALSFTGGTTASGLAISVPYTLSAAANGIASAPADFSIAPLSFSIPAGSTTAAATITLVDDSATEGLESTTLTLGTPTPAAVVTSSPTSYTLTIHDNDFNVTVTSATTLDTNQDGQIDLLQVVFSQAVTDATFPNFGANGGAPTADWMVSTYPNIAIAYGAPLASMGITDVANDNTIYLQFTPKTTPDTAAVPQLTTTTTPGLQSSGVPVSQVSIIPADGARPILMSAITESGTYDLTVTFSEPVQSDNADTTCAGAAPDNINVSFDFDYFDDGAGNSQSVTSTSAPGAAVDLNGCDATILIKGNPSAFAVSDLSQDKIAARANQVFDLSPARNAAPTNRVTITGVAHPYVVSAVSTSTTTVQVTFSDAMSTAGATSALLYSNYAVADNSGSNCHGSPAIAFATGTPIVQNSPTTFTLTTTAQKSCQYLITVSNVVGVPGNISLVGNTATLLGNEQFRVVRATCVDTTHFILEFNKPYAPTGPSGALSTDKYLLPRALGPTGVTSGTGPIGVAAVSGNASAVLITHARGQCANSYPIIVANNDTADGFSDTGRTIQSANAPIQNMSASPSDRVFLAGCGVDFCGPLLFDPFGDQSDFGSLANYQSRVYVGPNKNGNSAARFEYDGSQTSVLTFSIAKDTTNQGNSSTHRNTGVTAATGTYSTFGHSNCTSNSAVSNVGCGPDNENGRGVFGTAALNNQSYLLVGSVRTATQYHYFYLTSDTTALLNYKYVDLNLTGNVVGRFTQGLSAIQSLDNRQFIGMARSQIRRPDMSTITYNSADMSPLVTCPAPPLNCDIPTSQAPRLYINAMDYFGRCGEAPNTNGTGPSGSGSFCGAGMNPSNGTPRTPNGAWFGGVDSLYTPGQGTNMAPFLYSGNGGHAVLKRDGALIRSTTSNPRPCNDDIFDGCTSRHPNAVGGVGHWVDITPGRATGATGMTGPWYIGGTSGSTANHFSIELGKVADFVPGDRAYPQWAFHGNNLYVARNVCRTGDATVPADNTAENDDTAEQLDWREPSRGDARHSTTMWDGCMMNMGYCINSTGTANTAGANNWSCDTNADCNGGGTCQRVMRSSTITGDSLRRSQLWKCTPSGTGSNRVCNAGDWSLIDGGTAPLVTDNYTSFGNPTTNGNRTISMVITNGSYLYVGFDNPTTGVQIWRTNQANPSNEANWEQVSVSGLTDQFNDPDPTNQWQIYSSVSAQSNGVYYLYVATGKPGYPLSIYRFQNN